MPGSIAEGLKSTRARCALLAILSVLLVFSWTALRIHYACDGNWTAVFDTGAASPVPPDLQPGTVRFPGAGYDGQFYRDLAHDPFLRKDYFRYVDAPQERFSRYLVPLAAWLLAFGQPSWIDGAYIAVETLFVGLGVYWCARLLARRGQSPMWGWLFLVVPATLTSIDRMLVDGPLTALFAGFLLYCDEERWGRVWLVTMLAALTRETGLVMVAALVADRLWHRDWRRAVWFAASGIPALAWYAYLAERVAGGAPMSILAAPAWGMVRRLLWLRPYPDARIQLLLRVTDILAVLGLAISIFLAVRWLLQRQFGPVTFCIACFAVMALVFGGTHHMEDAFGYARPIAPMLLWIMLEAVSRRKWIALAPPLLISLSVSLVFARPLAAVARGVLGR